MSGKGTSTIERPEQHQRASDRGRSRLGDVTRPIHIDRRIAKHGRSTMLLAIVAIAIAWASAAGGALLGRKRLPRKAHGYPARSIFRIGFERLRTLLRADPIRTLDAWKRLLPNPQTRRVV